MSKIRLALVGAVALLLLAGVFAFAANKRTDVESVTPRKSEPETPRKEEAEAKADRPPEERPNILFIISDDQSWAHTGFAGEKAVSTPVFDRIASEGVFFAHAYTAAPSCSPSRAAILTGQEMWRLEEAANLWSTVPKKFEVYPDLLEETGYFVGFTGKKGWGPGPVEAGGRTRNPAGPQFESFAAFLQERPEDRPFSFWSGSHDPHRKYEEGSGVKAGIKLDDITVPPFLTDTDAVRNDMADYLAAIERFDRDIGAMLAMLEEQGELDDTIVVVTSDNGMPFPRAKSNLYDYGTRMPLAVRWPEKVPGGRTVEDFVSLTDLAPTILEAAGARVPEAMTGRSLLPILTSDADGQVESERDHAVFGMERHTDGRPGAVGYPMRAIRTKEYLYIRNYEPERWPAGDPEFFFDIDDSPTKVYMMDYREEETVAPLFDLAFSKRPAAELYDLSKDSDQLLNVADKAEYAEIKAELSGQLTQKLTMTEDPREVGDGTVFDQYPYRGPSKQKHFQKE